MLNKFNNISFYFFVEKQERLSKISSYLDEKEYTFFFEYENEIYAANEDSRLVFSKIKCRDDDLPSDWKTDLKFLGVKLIPSLSGEETSRYFGFKELKKIKNLDKDDVVKKIEKTTDYLKK
jgi:hypothetical protein